MEIFYVLTVITLILTFILFKKSEKKQNLINQVILSVICYLGFNILVCMIFGCLNITTNLLFLSILDLIVSAGFGFKIYKDKEIQSFEIRKRDILGVFMAEKNVLKVNGGYPLHTFEDVEEVYFSYI